MSKILKEFSGLTNQEAYVKIFSQRMMRPIPERAGEFFGTDQRLDMQPLLRNLVSQVPAHGEVFDVGAGAGDVIPFALRYLAKGTVINIEEPNALLVNAYLDVMKRYNLQHGIVYRGPLQDYYHGKRGLYPSKPQHLILAIHMIYHLTNFMDSTVNPEMDLVEAVSFLYDLLAPKGALFIVYADLLDGPKGEAICGVGEKYFRKNYPEGHFAAHLTSIYTARNRLLGPMGNMGDFLAEGFPSFQPIVCSERKESHFFGETLEDLAVLAMAAELCPPNSELFDLRKLEFCLDYVFRHPERLGIEKETRDIPQKGMWRANEPQVITIITKEG